MIKLEKGQIFTFNKMPDWVEYDYIYFYINDLKEIDKGYELEIDIIIEYDNHFIKGESENMKLIEDDIEDFEISIIDNDEKIAKLLLMR